MAVTINEFDANGGDALSLAILTVTFVIWVIQRCQHSITFHATDSWDNAYRIPQWLHIALGLVLDFPILFLFLVPFEEYVLDLFCALGGIGDKTCRGRPAQVDQLI
jgi:hypothetical protein